VGQSDTLFVIPAKAGIQGLSPILMEMLLYGPAPLVKEKLNVPPSYLKYENNLAVIFFSGYSSIMSWEVEYTDEFEEWWEALDPDEQDSVAMVVGLLEIRGPQLPFPYSSAIQNSRHSGMRELRIQHHGEPYRVLYAFDPRRNALLLLGGKKSGDDRWYEKNVPQAARLFDEHLKIFEEEGP